MWKVFKTEIKWLFSKPVKIIEYIIMLFIPFVYGFLYMNAYWAPFKHVDNLPVVILNNDLGDSLGNNSGEAMVSAAKERKIHVGNQMYTIKVNPAPSIYTKDEAGKKKIEQAVNSGKYAAAIVIPENFSVSLENFEKDSGIKDFKDFLNDLKSNHAEALEKISEAIDSNEGVFDIPSLTHNAGSIFQIAAEAYEFKQIIKKMNMVNILDSFNKYFGEEQAENNIDFYNDYKNSYLRGEMTNFGSGLTDTLLQIALSRANAELDSKNNEKINKITDSIYSSMQTVVNDLSDKQSILEYKPIGNNIDTYGKGLSPYFISIALFAGTLTMTFMIKNERHKGTKNITTTKHYLGKWLVWLLTGWAQAAILLTAVSIQGVNIGMNQYQIFMWGFFMSFIFSTFVQAVAFSIRYGDIGEFAIVIILVCQLISSSGTFPVEMQNIIFKILHPIVPFTYSIDGLRELLFQPDVTKLLQDMAILLLFPLVVLPISLTINILFDKRTMQIVKGKPHYKSFEINIGDM